MQLNDFKNDLIREFKSYFSDKAVDFVVNRMESEPYLDIQVEFTIYGYFVVGVLVERSTAFFIIREGNNGLKLFKSNLASLSGENILGQVVMEQLDREIRLRIPDKYLQEKYSI